MPWKEVCLVSIREEFVLRALEADANHAALCREYGIARKTGYKWIDRFQQGGVVALRNLDRRPLNSPLKVNGDVVAEIVKVRRTKRRWGARKIFGEGRPRASFGADHQSSTRSLWFHRATPEEVPGEPLPEGEACRRGGGP